MLRKEREGGSLSRQPGARSILSLIPTFATYIAKREKMHALKDYVQAAVLRTSETVARGSTKKKRQRTENSKISYPEAYNVTFPPLVFEPNDIQLIKGPNYSITVTQETGESSQVGLEVCIRIYPFL
mgnify:CR=1 FL=1